MKKIDSTKRYEVLRERIGNNDIDRRSFLIAAIGYIVALAATVFDGDGAAMTVLILGVILLLLGAFWERIRARLLKLLPGFVPLHRLPPSNT